MEPGQSCHIYNHANCSENIFREEENYRFSMHAKYLGVVVDTYANCLMPNHFHLFVGVKSVEGLESTFPKLEKLAFKQFSNFFNSYTQSFNKVYGRRGSLFMKNFKRTPVLNIRQWQETFLYIHVNPVKRGFVKNHTDWRWSSWNAYQNVNRSSNLNRAYFENLFEDWGHVKDRTEMKIEWLLNRELG